MTNKAKGVWAIGLMSGTSLDGLDAALLRSDGLEVVECGASLSLPFDRQLKHNLQQAVRQQGNITALEREFTMQNAQLVHKLLAKADMRVEEIAVIGFHGQTILHRPQEGVTRQIGDGALLAENTGIDVVNDFRSADMRAGGQGAPLVPLYHTALTRRMAASVPLAVLNIGGIANVTWIGGGNNCSPLTPPLSPGGGEEGERKRVGEGENIIAFDTGPGNVLLNEWMTRHYGRDYDVGGRLALTGRVDENSLRQMLRHPFFAVAPPKSLDRHDFDDILPQISNLSPADGAATLAAFTAAAVARAVLHMPQPPKMWLVAGGGRHNAAIMQQLQQKLAPAEVKTVEAVGWDGDALEAQAFAYLALRSRAGLPLTLPTTTGASCAVTGGAFYPA